jgi:hypothetical protein
MGRWGRHATAEETGHSFSRSGCATPQLGPRVVPKRVHSTFKETLTCSTRNHSSCAPLILPPNSFRSHHPPIFPSIALFVRRPMVSYRTLHRDSPSTCLFNVPYRPRVSSSRDLRRFFLHNANHAASSLTHSCAWKLNNTPSR